MSKEAFFYDVLHEFHNEYYKKLLTPSHVEDIKVIDDQAYFILKDGLTFYGLLEADIGELPIIVNGTERKNHGGKPYNLIKSYSSAKFRPEKKHTFRQLVDSFLPFEHSQPKDFLLWKIIALTATLGRLNIRVCSEPAFGKDSAIKVLGSLLGEMKVISNPTIAKLEYSLSNKMVMMNEMVNLNGNERRDVEQFLLSTGDLSNTYTKRSRASMGSQETYNIGDLSLLIAYNDLNCYPDTSKYFDMLFQKAVHNRFLPVKLKGKITEEIQPLSDAPEVAKEQEGFLKDFIRSCMWWKSSWRDEITNLHPSQESNKSAQGYNLEGRWASAFNTIRHFILLYCRDNADGLEAEGLLNALYNRHCDYVNMLNGDNKTLGRTWVDGGLPEELTVDKLEDVEEKIQ